MQIFSMYDLIAKESGPLFESKNVADALRKARLLLKNTPEINEADFTLLSFGTYNQDGNAYLETYLKPIQIKINAEDCLDWADWYDDDSDPIIEIDFGKGPTGRNVNV